nr:hypothetical protein [Solirubrobacterales bacterium]
MSSRPRPLPVVVAAITALVLGGPAGAAAHGNQHARERLSPRALKAAEARLLGPSHAAEHAVQR